LLEVADELVQAGVVRVALTGGEPLLHPACTEISRKLARAGVGIELNTNGALLPDRLDDLGGALSSVLISLDGSPAVHDELRGEGSWEQASDAASVARKAGLPVSFHTVLSNQNLGQVSEILRTGERHDAIVGFGALERVPAMGDAAYTDLLPSVASWREAIEGLIARKRGGDRRIQNSVAGLRYLWHWPHYHPIRCSAGLVYARIEADGRVFACGNLVTQPGAPSLTELSFSDAFATLPMASCTECWCDTRIELNLVFSGSPSAIRAAFVR